MLDHVNINAHTRFGLILLKSSKILSGNKIMTEEWNDRQPKSNINPTFLKWGYKNNL